MRSDEPFSAFVSRKVVSGLPGKPAKDSRSLEGAGKGELRQTPVLRSPSRQ
jgi:hypothetical protein